MTAKEKRDRSARERHVEVGEMVFAENFRGEPKWLAGTVIERTGPVSYRVQVGEAVWKRHVDQIRGCDLPVSRRLGITECVTNTHSGATSWDAESGDETGPLIVNGENNDQEDIIVAQVDGQNDNTSEGSLTLRI